jgi:hypothetical protein
VDLLAYVVSESGENMVGRALGFLSIPPWTQ